MPAKLDCGRLALEAAKYCQRPTEGFAPGLSSLTTGQYDHSMTTPNWTYMLRILGRNPDRIPMDRVGEYIRQFAELLGHENKPVFKGIKQASTGLKAAIPPVRRQHVHLRLVQARNEPDSRPARVLRCIEGMLGEDSIRQAELKDAAGNVIQLLTGAHLVKPDVARLYQHGSVDGVVTGLMGADDTMHLHLRDHIDRDLRLLVRNEDLARELLMRFRAGLVRVYVHGTWIRTDAGWAPEASKCTVEKYEMLDESSAREVFAALSETPGNGWKEMDDPMADWESLRGLH